MSSYLFGTAATETTVATTGVIGTGGAFSGGVAASSMTAAMPYIAPVVIAYFATEGFGTQRPDNAVQTKIGVKDAHQHPYAAVRQNIRNYSQYMKDGETQKAAFNLTQMDDTNDRFLENADISDELKEKWDALTDSAGAVGNAMGGAAPDGKLFTYTEEELAVMAEEAEGAVEALSIQAMDFAVDALFAGGATSELTTAATDNYFSGSFLALAA